LPAGESYDYKLTPLIHAMLFSIDIFDRTKGNVASGDRRLRETLAILIKNGADVKATMAGDYTALHIAAGRPNGAPLVKMLIAAGADINAKDDDGATPLHYAALAKGVYRPDLDEMVYPEPSSLKILLAAGADPNAKTADGQYNLPETALDWAKAAKIDEAVKLLEPVTNRSGPRFKWSGR